MSDTIRELVAQFGLDVDMSGFNKANAAFMNLGNVAKNALGAVGIGFGVGAAGHAIKGLVDDVAESTGRLARTAPLLGETTQSLQALEQGARQSGVPIEAVGAAAAHLREQFAAMSGAHGIPNFHASLRAVGISFTDTNGKMRSMTDLLTQVEKKVMATKDPIKQAVIATRYLGSAGEALLPAFRKGLGAAIAQADQDLTNFSAHVRDDDVDAIRAYKSELARLDVMFLGLKMSVAGPFTRLFADVTHGFLEWAGKEKGIDFKGIRGAMEGITAKLGPPLLAVMKGIAKGFEWIAKNTEYVMTWIVPMLALPALGWFAGLAGAIVAATAPLLLFAIPIREIMLWAEDIMLFLQYGDKADTVVGKVFPEIGKQIKYIQSLFQKGNWEEAFNQIGDLWLKMLVKMYNATVKFAEDTADKFNPFAKKKVGADYVSSGRAKADQAIVAGGGEFGLGSKLPMFLQSREYKQATERLEQARKQGLPAQEVVQDQLSDDEVRRRKFSHQPAYEVLRALGGSDLLNQLATRAQNVKQDRFDQAVDRAASSVVYNINLPLAPDAVLAKQAIVRVLEEYEEKKNAKLVRE